MQNLRERLDHNFSVPELVTNDPNFDKQFKADVETCRAELPQCLRDVRDDGEAGFSWSRASREFGVYNAAELKQVRETYAQRELQCTRGDTVWYYDLEQTRCILSTEIWHTGEEDESVIAPDPMAHIFRQFFGCGYHITECRFVNLCVRCGKESQSRCSICKRAHYCSRACQHQHWPQHKLTCAK